MTAPALPAAPNLGQSAALELLYAAVIGDRGELGRLVRGLALRHLAMPGNGQPWADCQACHGTGEVPAGDGLPARHCHCRCDLCTCNEPLCAGPCDTLAVMLDALVLHGLPAEACDVPRALATLRFAGIRRIVAHNTRRQRSVVDLVDATTGAARVTVSDHATAEAVASALRAEGYRCERQPVPGPAGTVRFLATPHA